MKAHQRIIREQKAKEKSLDLFGDWWRDIDADIKKAEVRRVTKQTAERIILEYEWLGTMHPTSSHFFGIFFGEYCGGVTCFGVKNSSTSFAKYVGAEHEPRGIQLHRGACVHWAHKHAGSMLISASIRELATEGYRWALAFSDSDAGEIGTLYQATNWYYIGLGSKTQPNIVDRTGRIVISSHHMFKTLGSSGRPAIDRFLAENPGTTEQPLNPKGRYVMLMGSKKDKKAMMKHLRPHIQPYPKRQ